MMPAPLWGIMPLENKMHSQCKFVLNIGFGRSPKIASWYQLALLATIANAKIS